MLQTFSTPISRRQPEACVRTGFGNHRLKCATIRAQTKGAHRPDTALLQSGNEPGKFGLKRHFEIDLRRYRRMVRVRMVVSDDLQRGALKTSHGFKADCRVNLKTIESLVRCNIPAWYNLDNTDSIIRRPRAHQQPATLPRQRILGLPDNCFELSRAKRNPVHGRLTVARAKA